jgi:hypothetical protein
MPPLRLSIGFSGFTRLAPCSLRSPLLSRPLTSTTIRCAQGYGDGEGDPKGENPQDQGSSNEIKHKAEHPGPPPPAEGQGTGVGPTKGGKTPGDSSAQSGGARSKDAKETGSSPTGGPVGGDKSKGGGSPKISDKSVPGGENSKEYQAEVERHNREFEKGHDRAPPAAEDKVDEKFWKGELNFKWLCCKDNTN